jgi:cell division protein FtsN
MKKNGDTQKETKPKVLTLTGQAVLGWGAGGLVLLALFFFLGTLVGRNMIRVDLDQDGLFLEISGSLEAENRLNLSAMERVPDEAPEFDFFKELNKDPGERKKVTTPPPSPASPAEKNRTVVKRRKTIVTPSQLATAPAAAIPAPAKPKATPAPKATDDHDPAIYKYTIQAGSFRTAEDADKMVARLKGQGYPAHWVKGLVRDNEIWFRVRIGAYRDKMDAASSLNRLKQDNVDAFLVKR